MLDQFERENLLDDKLSKMQPSHLDQLYLRFFNTEDGRLVLRDMENRSFINAPTKTDKDEGVRQAYLSIVARMKNTTQGGTK